MATYSRDEEYLKLLAVRDYTVKELARALFISEPTVRRDIARLKEKEMVICDRGTVRLKNGSAAQQLPILIRTCPRLNEKLAIAAQAIEVVKDGDTIMLDGSTSAQCLLPYLIKRKKLVVVTNSTKTAIELAALGIDTGCIGGFVSKDSFNCYGPYAEEVLKHYYADVAFFSCEAIDRDGTISDSYLYANSFRRVMIENSRQKYLLCDSTKYGRRLTHTLCNVKSLSGCFSEIPLTFD